MCQNHAQNPLIVKKLSWKTGLLLAAVILGVLTAYSEFDALMGLARIVSDIFIRLLKLISMPICFLSITATLSGMKDLNALRSLGGRVLRYTLLTTVLATVVALGFYLWVNPAVDASHLLSKIGTPSTVPSVISVDNHHLHILKYFIEAIPSNVMQPFIEGNIFGVMFLALVISLAVIKLPEEPKQTLHQLFSSLFSMLMIMTRGLIVILPLAIWAFITLFCADLFAMGAESGFIVRSIGLYLACVIGANLFQALVILPLFLKYHGLSPLKVAKAMAPALGFAFWSKSSSATLPLAIQCAETRLKIPAPIARFSLPLCTTINMNACAAFIMLTVMFVSHSYGMHFSAAQYVMWIFIASIAAIGNAGVPMGCYFLSSALIASLQLPLTMMAVILPFYSLIDMLETAINVWSDACVTAVTHQQIALKEGASTTSIDQYVPS
jgi:Na+/H+-dicarboxylate symporter